MIILPSPPISKWTPKKPTQIRVNKPDLSRDLPIFMICFIYSLEIINVVVPDPNTFLWIDASAADVASVNINGIEALLLLV